MTNQPMTTSTLKPNPLVRDIIRAMGMCPDTPRQASLPDEDDEDDRSVKPPPAVDDQGSGSDPAKDGVKAYLRGGGVEESAAAGWTKQDEGLEEEYDSMHDLGTCCEPSLGDSSHGTFKGLRKVTFLCEREREKKQISPSFLFV